MTRTNSAAMSSPPTGPAADQQYEIPPIEASVALDGQQGDFLERYYESRYLRDCGEPGHDYRLLFHSNGLIVVMLAPTHPLRAGGQTVTGIDYQVTEHTNRLENRVTGKGKRGAQVVTATAPLFRVTCADGPPFVVRAAARGKLVQLNEKLRQRPELLVTEGDGEGFVAVILPKLGQSGGQKAGTVDAAEYERRREAAVNRAAASARAAGEKGQRAVATEGGDKEGVASAEGSGKEGVASAEGSGKGDVASGVTEDVVARSGGVGDDKSAEEATGEEDGNNPAGKENPAKPAVGGEEDGNNPAGKGNPAKPAVGT